LCVNYFEIHKKLCKNQAKIIIYFLEQEENYSDMFNNNKLLEKGDIAPDFTVHTYNNESISLSRLMAS
jgi:hypothetical protein